MRDRYTCQYCGRSLPQRDLNLDHVVPKRYGGGTTWDNVVCCCMTCNRRKGGRTPEEARMRLIRKPAVPGDSALVFYLPHGILFEEWRPFMGSRSGIHDR
jgi:5-methylcytosine-specific restriction endonuclease McrA